MVDNKKRGDPLFFVSFVPETRFSLNVGKALLSGGHAAIAIFCAVVSLEIMILLATRRSPPRMYIHSAL